jgi:hypothetical protein
MMFSFFGSYNYVFQSVYHFNQKEVGLTFIGILVGFIFAILSFGIFDATLYRQASIKANGKPAPEHRLYAAMLGSFMLPIGLFWFAWAPSKDVHWIVPVLAGVPFGWGCLGIFVCSLPPSSLPLLPHPYQNPNTFSTDISNNLPRQRLPIRKRCISRSSQRHPALRLRRRVPALHDTDVPSDGCALGGKRVCFCECRVDAGPVGLLLEGEGVEGEELL